MQKIKTTPLNDIGFTHAFQPIIDIDLGETVSYEVLLRGVNNEPAETVFDQIAKSHLMNFDQLSRKKALILASRLGVSCSVNLNFTPNSILFDNGRFIEETLNQALKLSHQQKQLVLEITESDFIQDMSSLLFLLNKFRQKGIIIAIDDFGAGYAGLNMLAEIQPDLLKLDMSLLRNIHQHGPRQSIVRAICSVCLDLGVDVLAEGVETKEEFNFLRQIGISLYQGYFFARPGFECLPKVNLPK